MVKTKINYLKMCLFTLLQTIIFVIALSLFRFPVSDSVFMIGILITCSLFIFLGSLFGCLMLTCTITKEGIRPFLLFSAMSWGEITKAKKSFYTIKIRGNTFNRSIMFPGPFIVSNKGEVYTYLKENVPEGNPLLEIIQKIKI